MHLMGTPFGAPICGHPIGYPHAPNGHPIRGTHISEIYFIRGRTMCSHRPHFVVLNGHPYGAPIWVPYRAPISRFHFVKLLPLRGRHVCMWGAPWRCTYFARFHFVISFLLRAPSGPLMPPSGAYGYPYGHPLKNSSFGRAPIDPGGIEPQPIKLEFTIYPAELWI